jgi:hypothetical protein
MRTLLRPLPLLAALALVACPAPDPDPPPACDDGPHAAIDCELHLDLAAEHNYRRLQNEDEEIDVVVVRETIGYGPGETTQYDLAGFALVMDGCLHCIEHPDSLAYDTGHHNWFDDADATIDGVIHRVHMQYQPEDPDDMSSEWVWSYSITGLEEDGETVLWGPIELELTEGPVW